MLCLSCHQAEIKVLAETCSVPGTHWLFVNLFLCGFLTKVPYFLLAVGWGQLSAATILLKHGSFISSWPAGEYPSDILLKDPLIWLGTPRIIALPINSNNGYDVPLYSRVLLFSEGEGGSYTSFYIRELE